MTSRKQFFIDAATIAVGILIFGLLCAYGAPPLPPGAKVVSPKVAGAADAHNQAMAVGVSLNVTNNGHVSADFAATQIVGLSAGFVYKAGTNGWKVLGMTNYPMNGGTVTMNFSGTNVPECIFRAFFEFPNPTP